MNFVIYPICRNQFFYCFSNTIVYSIVFIDDFFDLNENSFNFSKGGGPLEKEACALGWYLKTWGVKFSKFSKVVRKERKFSGKPSL